MIQPAAAGHGQHQQCDTDQRPLDHAAGSEAAHVQPHQHGDGDGSGHRCRGPRAVLHGVHDHQPQHRDEDDHDGQDAQQRGIAPHGAQLVAGHLPEGTAVSSGGEEQDDEILDAAAQHRTDQDPQGSRQVPELGGEGGTHQGAGPGDGSEMMAEQEPLVVGQEIPAVVEALGRGRSGRVDDQDLGGNERAIEAVSDGVNAERGDDEPAAVDGFAPTEGDAPDRTRPQHRDGAPQQPLGQCGRSPCVAWAGHLSPCSGLPSVARNLTGLDRLGKPPTRTVEGHTSTRSSQIMAITTVRIMGRNAIRRYSMNETG